MYIDSTNFVVPTGDQTVARELRKHVEGLLYVCMKYLHSNFARFNFNFFGCLYSEIQSGCCVLGSPSFLPAYLPYLPREVH